MYSQIRSGVRCFVAIFLALATAVTLAAAVPTAVGAASDASGGKVDKAAVLRVGVPIENSGGVWFDPVGPRAGGQNPTVRIVLDQIYDAMIHPTPDGTGAPGLATKWTTPDASTVELTLRPGVKFADGSPFNAAAVKAAWDRIRVQDRPNITPNIKAITSVEAVNDNTVRVHLNAPVVQDLVSQDLTSGSLLAVPSPAAVAAGTVESKPVGAGPYQLQSYTPGKLVLTKNPNYYDPAAQKLAGIEFNDVAYGAPSVSALQAGTVDLVWNIPPDAVKTIKGQTGLDVTSVPSENVITLNLCPTSGPFASKEARQAVQYAIDRDAVNKAALDGTGSPATSPVAPTSPFYDAKAAKTYKYNPAKAKALLKEAGVAPGTTVKALVSTSEPFPAAAEIVQSQLKDVGLNLEITKTTNAGADLLRLAPELSVVQLSPGLYGYTFTSGLSALNVCNVNNPDIIAALTAAKDPTKSPAEQKASWSTFQKEVLDESRVIPVALTGVLAGHTTKVKGVEVITPPYGPEFFGVYKTK